MRIIVEPQPIGDTLIDANEHSLDSICGPIVAADNVCTHANTHADTIRFADAATNADRLRVALANRQ